MNALAADPASANQKRFVKLVRKRLERFVTLLPKLLVSDDAETVDDLRVSSRRLKQAMRRITQRIRSVRGEVARRRAQGTANDDGRLA